MHESDVHEALHQSCEIHDPVSGVQAIGQGWYGHMVKMYFILENLFIYNSGVKLNACVIHETLDLTFHEPFS